MSVQAGAAVVDLALPGEVPVAVLIASIVEIVHGPAPHPEAISYRLSPPGNAALPESSTLAQNGIVDGAVLVLSRSAPPAPVARYDDAAEAVSAALATPDAPAGRRTARAAGAVAAACLTGIGCLALVRNACSGSAIGANATAAVAAAAAVVATTAAAITHRAHRDAAAGLTMSALATAFAAVAGFVGVPGRPGMPNVLLAAMAAAVTAALAARVSGCDRTALTAVTAVAMAVAVAAAVGVLTGAPAHAIGAVSTLASLGLLGLAARVSLVLAGLSPRLDDSPPDADRLAAAAVRADRWLTGLVAAGSAAAAAGAAVTVLVGGPRLGRLAFAAVTGMLLLLRARTVGGRRALALVAGGLVAVGAALAAAAIGTPERGPWIAAATATLAGAAACLGWVAPALTRSPPLHRGVGLLEWLGLVSMAPLTCWVCGAYSAVRGLDFR